MNVLSTLRLVAASIAAAAALSSAPSAAFAATPSTAAAAATAPAAASVDVNRATQAELESVRGIGPAMSAKILAERQKGAFRDWPDLIGRVAGIGEKSAAKLSAAGLNVGGAAMAAPTTVAAAPKPASKKP